MTLALLCSAVATVLFQDSQKTPPVMPRLSAVPRIQEVKLSDKPAMPLSLDEVSLLTLRNNPRARAAAAATTSAQGRVDQARSALNPALALSATATDFASISQGSSNSSTSGSGNLASSQTTSAAGRWLVTDFGKSNAAVSVAAKTLESVKMSEVRTLQVLVYQSRTAYLNLVRAKALTQVQVQALANRQGQLDLAKARFNAGPGAPSDILRAQTAVASAAQDLVAARAAELQAQVALALALGLDPTTTFQPTEPGEAGSSPSLDSSFQDALEHRPDLAQSKRLVEAAGFAVTLARLDNAPSLSATAGYASRGTANAFDTQGLSLGLQVTWPIGDGGMARAKAKSAKADLEAAQASLDQAVQTVKSDVASAYAAYLYAQETVKVAASQLENAKESLRIAEGRFRVGLGTFLEVTDAETSLVSAQQAEVTAKTNLVAAWYTLRLATGS